MNRRKNLDMALALCVFLAALAGPAGADTYYVDPNGSADFNSIQAAIDDANDDDQIEVAPGTYYEAIDFKGKGVRLYSRDGRDVTTIDANGAYHAVKCVSGEDANTILEGFTITGGNANGPQINDKRGGGMYCDNSSPTVTNCTFSGNSASGLGSAGGGMANLNNSSPTVTGCTFSGNWSNNGGGMYNDISSPTVTNCTFTGNSATSNGGGMHNYISSPTVTNCTFTGNSATSNGGAIYNYDSTSPTVTNCTFSGNQATSGGGMYNYYSSPTVANCILWGDTPGEIYNDASSPIVTYSDVQGVSVYPGTGNINSDPCFLDADSNNFHLSPNSPCIDAGDNNSLPADTADLDGDGNTAEPIPFDADGRPRVVDGNDDGSAVVDMGAFEFLRIHNMTKDRWYATIQAAIDDANDGDEIEVAAGTYYEAINFNGKAIRLYSSGGQEVTTIDGTGHYHVVQCVSGEDANTILEGFTITGGNANGSGIPEPNHMGGGMYNSGSSPTVTNCTFSGNSAGWDGGGMYNNSSNPTVTNCTFSGNSASYGGGMYNYDSSSPTVANCIFSDNSTDMWGGGMLNYNSSPTVTNCTFSGNSASGSGSGGGGIYNYDSSSPTVANCILWGDEPNEICDDATSSTTVNYSDIQGGWGGAGGNNINADPCFADADSNDLHLKSQAGRWDPCSENWVCDSVTSPCIDTGDPNSDCSAEPLPHGSLINMGAFGGTTQASKSPFGAYNPSPPDGATDVMRETVLRWSPGLFAASHNVYLGPTFDDVNDADTETPVIFRGNQGPNEYNPGELDFGTTYYWRIDEVNETYTPGPNQPPAPPNGVWKGNVWSFTVANYLVVDDMESYDTTIDLWGTWNDGAWNLSGSGIWLGVDPCDPVHTGDQSMVFEYDNTGFWDAYHSEIDADPFDLEVGTDWTQSGVKSLTIYFYGDPNNDANNTEQMYVGLEDTTGPDSYAEVRYGDYGEDMNDIKKQEWTEWNIALSDFNDVILTEVAKVVIGFGDRTNPWPGGTPGGTGIVYFDDLRLYRPRCLPEKLPPAGDFNGNCVVEYDDLSIVAQEWLTTGVLADLYDDDNVNFRDYAIVAEGWLQERLWPEP